MLESDIFSKKYFTRWCTGQACSDTLKLWWIFKKLVTVQLSIRVATFALSQSGTGVREYHPRKIFGMEFHMRFGAF